VLESARNVGGRHPRSDAQTPPTRRIRCILFLKGGSLAEVTAER
jgi:hypothetical protein